jgi:hypothetical protein
MFFRCVTLVFLLTLANCGRDRSLSAKRANNIVESLIQPQATLTTLRARGGGSFHGTSTFRLSAKVPPSPHSVPKAKDTITTVTDLWLDGKGNFRLVETNDQDGGREIIRVNSEAVVAIRYGKPIRRSMTSTEAETILLEALGGPYAAWEIAYRQVLVEMISSDNFRLRRSDKALRMPPASTPLRSWRDTVVVKTVEGEIRSEKGLLTLCTLLTTFDARQGPILLDGEMAVTVTMGDEGKVASIVLPAADASPSRQRTTLDERALLGGLQGMHRRDR